MAGKKLLDRWQAIIDRTEIVDSTDQYQDMIDTLVDKTPSDGAILAFVNAHAMNMVLGDRSFFEALTQSDILLRDGSGITLLYKILRMNPGANMNGTDFIPEILSSLSGARVAFWGTREPYLSSAIDNCSGRFDIEIVSVENGFHKDDYYLDALTNLDLDVLLLGMGMPRQEILATRLKEASPNPILIICGGAIIDFLGEKTSRAPKILRQMGLEWFYRLAQEPKRMFSRYVIGNPLFVCRALIFSCFR